MKAILKDMRSLELEEPLEKYWPDNPISFGTWVRLMVGPEHEMGMESFDLFLCTPDWIKKQCTTEKYMWGYYVLVVCEYDLDLIKSKISHYIESCTGHNWRIIARKLSKIGVWEFEDYQPYRP